MMTSSNGNIFRATDPLWGESTGHDDVIVMDNWCLPPVTSGLAEYAVFFGEVSIWKQRF